jgi:hypothetical protein
MDRRVQMGARVHHGTDAMGHDAVLGVLRRAMEKYIVEAGQGGDAMTPDVAELVEN